MTYSLVLTFEKTQETKGKGVLKEIKEYISDKKGKILNENPLGQKNINSSLNKGDLGSLLRLEIEFPQKETQKLKKALSGKRAVISHLLTKIDIGKRERAQRKQKKAKVPKKRKIKEDAPKAEKILSSIEEEKERIKDLDNELDKILNE